MIMMSKMMCVICREVEISHQECDWCSECNTIRHAEINDWLTHDYPEIVKEYNSKHI